MILSFILFLYFSYTLIGSCLSQSHANLVVAVCQFDCSTASTFPPCQELPVFLCKVNQNSVRNKCFAAVQLRSWSMSLVYTGLCTWCSCCWFDSQPWLISACHPSFSTPHVSCLCSALLSNNGKNVWRDKLKKVKQMGYFTAATFSLNMWVLLETIRASASLLLSSLFEF